MKYIEHYHRLIQKRRLHPITREDCYCEQHHILPRSMGGDNSADNLIMLTAREHFIAHKLLFKHYQQVNDRNGIMRMGLALGRLATGNKQFIENVHMSSREYAEMREAWQKAMEIRDFRLRGSKRYHNAAGDIICVKPGDSLPDGDWIEGTGISSRGGLNWMYIQHRITGEVRHVKVDDNFVMPEGFERGGSHPTQHTMWITNGVNNQKIDKNASIPTGWRRGRTICEAFRRVATSATKGSTGMMWIHNPSTNETRKIKVVDQALFLFPGSPFRKGVSSTYKAAIIQAKERSGSRQQKLTKHRNHLLQLGLDIDKIDLEAYMKLPWFKRKSIWRYTKRCEQLHQSPSYEHINQLLRQLSV